MRFSHRAEADAIQIGVSTLRTWSEDQDERYINDLEACCYTLAGNPDPGRAANSVRLGLRRMEQGRHVVFYRREKGGTPVARILHQRMMPGMQSVGDETNAP